MALFRCASGGGAGGEITVTYGADFYGATITCTRGLKVYSKTATSSGSVEFTVDEEGDWLIESTIEGTTYSVTATVTFMTTKELTAIPDGETVLPTDDITKWLECAGIMDKSYTTLSQVLGDSETYNALLGDINACAYMKRSTTWSTDICASQYAMNLLGQYDTACDALLSDATWTTALNNSSYWHGHTDTGEKIHGGNPTYDSFYRIVDGNHVPVTDPSLLDAGTYTIYSNGLAKATDLTSDYGKTVRICPNTKEIVVRPDNSLYWYGIKRYDLEVLNSSNGWTCQTYRSFGGTVNEDDTSMTLVPSADTNLVAVGSNNVVNDDITVHAIGKWLITSGSNRPDAEYAAALTNKSFALSTAQIVDNFANFTNAMSHVSAQFSNGGYIVAVHDPYNSNKLQLNIQALWYE